MKKIAILSIALVAFASCAKERTCTCTTTSNQPGFTTEEKTIVYKKITKSNAKAACISIDITPDGQPYTENRVCTLK